MIHGSGMPFYSKSTLYADKLLSMYQDQADLRSLKRGRKNMVADYLALLTQPLGEPPSQHTNNHIPGLS
jgi:hypothetical protein